MRLSVPKSSLLWSVQHSYAVASRKASLPILTNLLVRGKETGRVHLAATDLYLGIKTECDAQVEEGGTLAVGARTLYDIVKNMPEGEIHLQSKGAHQLEISCGRVRYCITTLTADDFPPLPNPEDANFFELPAQPLSRLIAQTSFAMSNDDTRPHLAAALLEIQGATMRMVATDGHRMAKAECTISGEVPEAELLMLVPHKGIHELKKMTDGSKSSRQSGAPTHVRVAQHGGLAFFQQQNLELSVKLVDGGFPPYDKIIPKEQNKRVVVERTALSDALKRIALVVSERSAGVRVQLSEGKVGIFSQSSEVGEGSEELDVDYVGDALSIGFNAKYMLDALGALDADEVCLELGGELDPVLVRPVQSEIDFVGVIMPIRI